MSELKQGDEIVITDEFTLVFDYAKEDFTYCHEKGKDKPLLFVGLDVERDGECYVIQHI